MRTMITIFLLFLLASVQTPLGQLFKIPALLTHFNKHQEQEGISLVDFLKEHYSQGHSDADLPEDDQLPFKADFFYTIGVAIVPGFIKPQINSPLVIDKKITFPGFYTAQQHLSSIFHPPRA